MNKGYFVILNGFVLYYTNKIGPCPHSYLKLKFISIGVNKLYTVSTNFAESSTTTDGSVYLLNCAVLKTYVHRYLTLNFS